MYICLYIYIFIYIYIYIIYLENIVPEQICNHSTINKFQHSLKQCTGLIASCSQSKITGLQMQISVKLRCQIDAFTMSICNISVDIHRSKIIIAYGHRIHTSFYLCKGIFTISLKHVLNMSA